MVKRMVLGLVFGVALLAGGASAELVNCQSSPYGVTVVRPNRSCQICGEVCDFANPDGTIVGWMGFDCVDCQGGRPTY